MTGVQTCALPISQPFNVAEQFSGLTGRYVPLSDTVESFKKLLQGDYDKLPEMAFMFVGTIDEAVTKAEQLGYKA